MVAAWVIHAYFFRNKFGFISAAVVGYIVGNIAVLTYWNFAKDYAPTKQIREEIMSKDGAPLAAAPFILPIYVLFSFFLVAPISLLICDWLPTKPLKINRLRFPDSMHE